MAITVAIMTTLIALAMTIMMIGAKTSQIFVYPNEKVKAFNTLNKRKCSTH